MITLEKNYNIFRHYSSNPSFIYNLYIKKYVKICIVPDGPRTSALTIVLAGLRKLGPRGGRVSNSRSTRDRVTEEGATSRRRAWRPRTSVTRTVKMGRRKVVSKLHFGYQ